MCARCTRGRTDVPTGSPGDDHRKNLPPLPMSPGDGEVSLSLLVPLMGKSSRRSGITGLEQSPAMCFPRTEANPGEVGAVELGYRTVVGFSQIYSAPSECGAVKLDFRRASGPPGESGVEECDYITPAPLTEWSVCARTVTGSLLFGSPHRLVRSCRYSVVLSLQWIDDLDISRESTSSLQNLNLGTIDHRITPDICISGWHSES